MPLYCYDAKDFIRKLLVWWRLCFANAIAKQKNNNILTKKKKREENGITGITVPAIQLEVDIFKKKITHWL